MRGLNTQINKAQVTTIRQSQRRENTGSTINIKQEVQNKTQTPKTEPMTFRTSAFTGIWICVVPSSFSPQKHKSALLFFFIHFFIFIFNFKEQSPLDVMRQPCLIYYVEILFRAGSFPPKHIATLMWTKQPDSHPSETQDDTNSSATLTELPCCDAQVLTQA